MGRILVCLIQAVILVIVQSVWAGEGTVRDASERRAPYKQLTEEDFIRMRQEFFNELTVEQFDRLVSVTIEAEDKAWWESQVHEHSEFKNEKIAPIDYSKRRLFIELSKDAKSEISFSNDLLSSPTYSDGYDPTHRDRLIS
jgi:hypothetical protein